MLLTLTTTMPQATDLGFLLHKHPDKAQTFPVSAGAAHVFYPRATDAECTAALLLEVDPIALVRGDRGQGLFQYVNDRPYAASSMLGVALGSVFRTAMNGRCDLKPELPGRDMPLSMHLPVVPARGGADLVRRLFEPLGWAVAVAQIEESRYVDLRLTGSLRLADALNHLYVLLPVLDDSKHYWVSHDEIDKLLRAGEGWLAGHPERELISRRYLAHQRGYVRSALERLGEVDEFDTDEAEPDPKELTQRRESLAELRRGAVLAVLRQSGARRVVDLGCGPGALLRLLVKDEQFTEILGVDVSAAALRTAADRLNDRELRRITLRQSALTYRDAELAGYDAAVLMEVVEHIDPPRLPALERSVFAAAKPRTVVVTTPNVEYNVRYEGLAAGAFRHPDHRFEWTRAQFAAWSQAVAAQHGYRVQYLPVGESDPELGPPTQMAVFTREEGA
ncbi:3' terminal RNA ribose 2'-O-methyltransferase Hen1 [Kutzneria sp. CA-103260]|uniref:3' terminal RNA ribose 2'-O-methyltransferase Hen1 n=1 Tax=Kutzneria sp. CA-103260 TaxID=2802641 RepID=UPI001BABC123|nr:3' terminal RNA ribose 2'-O-methyltransferase Hen1 [Kutzneria sp. CA-103260]QUQ69160.1 3' terminal RNA ribose 2'-O-methyltransferase Hen1 [Kutzneria sp. CA-103260]